MRNIHDTPYKYAWHGSVEMTGAYSHLVVTIARIQYCLQHKPVCTYSTDCLDWNLEFRWQTDSRPESGWYGCRMKADAKKAEDFSEIARVVRRLTNKDHYEVSLPHLLEQLGSMRNALETYNDPRLQNSVAIGDFEKVKDLHVWRDSHRKNCTVHGYTKTDDSREGKTAVAKAFAERMDDSNSLGWMNYTEEFEAWLAEGRPVQMIGAPDIYHPLEQRRPRSLAEQLKSFEERRAAA